MKKTVLITGGVRGIGLSIAKAFQAKNYRVCVAYSKDEESALSAKEQGLEVYRADVSKEADVMALFSNFQTLDVLVNNAGVSLIKQIQDVSLAEFERVFAVNMGGAFLCAREASKRMIAQKSGLIVNVSSVWGEVGGSCESVYSASKAGLIGFTKALAKELGYSGIRVNSISPGVIDTEMNSHFTPLNFMPPPRIVVLYAACFSNSSNILLFLSRFSLLLSRICCARFKAFWACV